MDFNYVAVSHHPSDVVVLNTGMYAEVFSFIHYNRELQKLSSSSSGAQQQQQQQQQQKTGKSSLLLTKINLLVINQNQLIKGGDPLRQSDVNADCTN